MKEFLVVPNDLARVFATETIEAAQELYVEWLRVNKHLLTVYTKE